MKFTIKEKDIQELILVCSIAGGIVPISGYVKLSNNSATAVGIGAETQVPIDFTGEICIYAKTLKDFLKIATTDITITTEGKFCTLSCNGFSVKAATEPAMAFPSLNFSHVGVPSFIDAESLSLLKRVSDCIIGPPDSPFSTVCMFNGRASAQSYSSLMVAGSNSDSVIEIDKGHIQFLRGETEISFSDTKVVLIGRSGVKYVLSKIDGKHPLSAVSNMIQKVTSQEFSDIAEFRSSDFSDILQKAKPFDEHLSISVSPLGLSVSGKSFDATIECIQPIMVSEEYDCINIQQVLAAMKFTESSVTLSHNAKMFCFKFENGASFFASKVVF